MTENLKDIIKKEYLKCALDCEYFLRKYSYIQVPNKGRQLFDLFDYQAEALARNTTGGYAVGTNSLAGYLKMNRRSTCE